MRRFPPSKVTQFCDNKTSKMVLSHVNKQIKAKDRARLKLALTEYLEWSSDVREFDENFVLRFIESLFSQEPKKSIETFFKQYCYDGFANLNSRLDVLVCHDFHSFRLYCENLNIDISKRFLSLIKLLNISPRQFTKNNGYSFSSLFESYRKTDLLNIPERYLADHGLELWVPAACELHNLCSILEISFEAVCESPAMWGASSRNIHYAFLNRSKADCKKFALLFSKPPQRWFEGSWLDKVL